MNTKLQRRSSRKEAFIQQSVLAAMALASGNTAIAQVSVSEKAQIIGGYIGGQSMMVELKRSPCSYVIQREYLLSDALKEVLPYLTENEADEMMGYVKSDSFKRQVLDNANMIKSGLAAAKKDGLDEKTACGILTSTFSQVYSAASEKWKALKKTLPLR